MHVHLYSIGRKKRACEFKDLDSQRACSKKKSVIPSVKSYIVAEWTIKHIMCKYTKCLIIENDGKRMRMHFACFLHVLILLEKKRGK